MEFESQATWEMQHVDNLKYSVERNILQIIWSCDRRLKLRYNNHDERYFDTWHYPAVFHSPPQPVWAQIKWRLPLEKRLMVGLLGIVTAARAEGTVKSGSGRATWLPKSLFNFGLACGEWQIRRQNYLILDMEVEYLSIFSELFDLSTKLIPVRGLFGSRWFIRKVLNWQIEIVFGRGEFRKLGWR